MKKLDLHTLSHEEVPEIVHRFINENWSLDNELHIITGHSQKMKNIVTTILKMYDVTSTILPHNPGVIIISI